MSQWLLCMWHTDQPNQRGLVGPFADGHEASDWFTDNKLGDYGMVYATSELTSPMEALESVHKAQQEQEGNGS